MIKFYDILKAMHLNYSDDYFTQAITRIFIKPLYTVSGTLPITLPTKPRYHSFDAWTIYGNDEIGKNRLELGNYTTAAFGIYRINMGDGKLHIYGKSTNQSAFRALMAVDTTLPAGTYTITGTIDDKYRLQVLDTTDSSRPVSIAIDDGQGADFTLTDATPIRVNLLVRSSAYNLDVDMVITPMLRLANTSSDFEPYQIGVGEHRQDGYYVPLTVSQTGQTDKTYDIYIGDSPLTEGETVSQNTSETRITVEPDLETTISTTLENKPEMKIIYN